MIWNDGLETEARKLLESSLYAVLASKSFKYLKICKIKKKQNSAKLWILKSCISWNSLNFDNVSFCLPYKQKCWGPSSRNYSILFYFSLNFVFGMRIRMTNKQNGSWKNTLNISLFKTNSFFLDRVVEFP